jgi:hypothetical protein
MHRSVALILMLLFSWLLVQPLVASSNELSLPSCCRKGGKHHCMMTRAAQANDTGLGIKTIAAKCPCCPHFTTASQVQSVPPGVGKAVFAGLVSHPAVCSQTEAGYRVSRSRSQHKRGPPVLIFS